MRRTVILRPGFAALVAVMLAGASCGGGGSNATDGGKGGGGGGKGGAGGGKGGAGGSTADAAADTGGGSGGAGGAGGTTTGTGGTGGAMCTTPQFTQTYLFGSFNGWGVPPSNPTPSLAFMMGVDAGTFESSDPNEGNPMPPSARLEIPFSDVGQQWLFAQNYPTPLNLTGTTVTAQIKLDSGLLGDPVTSVARAFLVLKSTSAYVYATGVAINLDASAGWTTLTVSSNSPSTLPFNYDPCDIREIDVEIDTGQTGTYTKAVVHIDTIAITAPPNPDAATDGVDGATDGAASDAPASDAPATPDATTAPDVTTSDTATGN
jgi:hypothetical protein